MADLRPMASATELNHVMAPLEPGSVVYRERSRVFILNGAKSSYAFRVDAHGWLEHLYWGPQVDASDELGYLSFANVSLPFDPKVRTPPGSVDRERPIAIFSASSFRGEYLCLRPMSMILPRSPPLLERKMTSTKPPEATV